MKKFSLVSVILFGILLSWIIPAGAEYEQPISFSDVLYFESDGVTPIEAPQSGTFYVSSTASYGGSDSKTAYMLCVVTDASVGSIKAVSISNKAQWPGDDNQILKAELSVSDISGCNFNYYFIDNIGFHTPLKNQPPGLPGEISVENVTENGADLSWDSADDDFRSVTGYEIYKNGAYLTTVSDTNYRLNCLMRNSENKIEVKSSDGLNLSEAVSAEITTTPVKQLVFDVEKRNNYFRVGEEGNNLLLIAANNGAGRINKSSFMAGRTYIEIEGTSAASGSTSVNGAYPGFTVNSDYISEDDREIVFEFTYFDMVESGRTTTTIKCEALSAAEQKLRDPMIYDPDNPDVETTWSKKPVVVRNTGVWKTVTRTFSQAKFPAGGIDGIMTSMEFGKNFRLTSGNSGDFYLSSGCLYKKDDYVTMNPNMIVDGGMVVYDMDFTLSGGYDIAYQLAEKDGINCVSSTDAGNLSYSVTNKNVTNASDAKLEVCFYDEAEGDTLYVAGKAVPMDGSGWREIILDVSGTDLSSFELSKASGSTVYIKSIQAYVI